MTITERTLKQWRKQALMLKSNVEKAVIIQENWAENYLSKQDTHEVADRILRMTQELLDLHLMEK